MSCDSYRKSSWSAGRTGPPWAWGEDLWFLPHKELAREIQPPRYVCSPLHIIDIIISTLCHHKSSPCKAHIVYLTHTVYSFTNQSSVSWVVKCLLLWFQIIMWQILPITCKTQLLFFFFFFPHSKILWLPASYDVMSIVKRYVLCNGLWSNSQQPFPIPYRAKCLRNDSYFHVVVQGPFLKDIMNLASLILVLWQAAVEGSGLGKSYWIW